MITAVFMCVIVVVGGWFYLRVSRTGLPQLRGEVPVAVEDEVDVVRDDYGTPHIFASHPEDLFFAQGYVHAQDRIWQMDMLRRAVTGRLSEILGPEALEVDRFALTVGYRRAAERSWEALSTEGQRMLEAYAQGVNAYLDKHRRDLPPEFLFLDYEPRPWTPVDSLGIAKFSAWVLGGNMDTELLLSALIAQVGPERARELFPYYPEDGDTVIERARAARFSPHEAVELARLSRLGELGGLAANATDAGSNSWAVSGALTKSGHPLLANDMHLFMELPALWYVQQLALAEAFKVTGVTFPGVPGVVAGHNEHIAWGLTNVGADVQDLFEIRFHPEEPHLYAYLDGWREAKLVTEAIPIKGSDEPEELRVRITHHGPVVSDVVELDRGRALSLRWTALEPTREADMFIELAYAENWDDFTSALEHFMAPAQNFVFADRHGNIGFRANGLFPIRRAGDGLLPAPGWTDTHEWEGYVPWDELPSAYNPPEELIVTANQRIVGEDYPYLISHEWTPPYRAEAIRRGLEGRTDLTLDDMKELQGSFYNTQAEKILPVFIGALDTHNLEGAAADALQLLKAWATEPLDDAELAAPLVYHTLYLTVLEDTFRAELGADLFERLLAYRSLITVVDRMLTSGESAWFTRGDLVGPDARDAIIRDAFSQAVARLSDAFGSSVEAWSWGAAHQLTFRHAAAQTRLAALILNRGPFPVGGSSFTPAMMGYALDDPFGVTMSAPWRYVVDIVSLEAYDALAIGNSGHPFSPHYDDQLELWLTHAYKPLVLYSEDISPERNQLRLVPAPR